MQIRPESDTAFARRRLYFCGLCCMIKNKGKKEGERMTSRVDSVGLSRHQRLSRSWSSAASPAACRALSSSACRMPPCKRGARACARCHQKQRLPLSGQPHHAESGPSRDEKDPARSMICRSCSAFLRRRSLSVCRDEPCCLPRRAEPGRQAAPRQRRAAHGHGAPGRPASATLYVPAENARGGHAGRAA